MTAREAKRRVCHAVAQWVFHSDCGSSVWDGVDPCSEDGERVQTALDDLAEELFRRGCERAHGGKTSARPHMPPSVRTT